MYDVTFEESRKHVSVDAPAAVCVYRPQTEFSQFIMDVVDRVRELDIQRVVILVQVGVEISVVDDAVQRIAQLLAGEKLNEERKIALECFHGFTRAELRKMKRQWQKARNRKGPDDV